MAKFEKFCGLRYAKPTSVMQLAIIAYTDCCRTFFLIYHNPIQFSSFLLNSSTANQVLTDSEFVWSNAHKN